MASAATSARLDNECDEESVLTLFNKAYELYQSLMDSPEDFRTEKFQSEVKRCILMLEDVTRGVSVLDMFARNENIKEMPADHIRFFLLPALLSNMQGKIFCNPDQPGSNREEVIDMCEIYLRDFLQRVKDYEVIPNLVIPAKPDEDQKENAHHSVLPQRGPQGMGRPSPMDLARMNAEREGKIRRFKEKKELESRLGELTKLLEAEGEDRVDDDVKREFYLKTVTVFAHAAVEDLHAFTQERPILAHLAKVRAGLVREAKPEPKRPLKPIIITRDAVQKEVFGLGYRNVPILSIEEFYEQRVRDGWFPDPATVKKSQSKSLQDQTNIDQKAQEEEEEREKEEKEERDDEEELARKRAFDEYKDEHKRGEGNRHNKG